MGPDFNMEKLEEFLHLNKSVKFIRLQWVDYSGVLRAHFVPVGRCLQIANGDDTVHLSGNSMTTPISIAPDVIPLHEYHERWDLLPDWSSLRRCGLNTGHAVAMSFVDQKQTHARFDKCPRMLLTRALERFEKQWRATVTIGFEIEFVLLDKSNESIKPLDRPTGYSSTAGLRGETLDLVEEIMSALEKSSIAVHHFNTEAEDQLKIALAAQPVLQAIDSLVLAQETIRTICTRRNIKAAMTPKSTFSGPSNGLHLHLSLHTLMGPRHFIAGILSHMTSLYAFGMANYDSYVRSNNNAAGEWIGFGTNNRDLPVRRIDEQHWEFRMMDSTANPYLFTAAVLFAGMDGLKNYTKLIWQDCTLFPDLMSGHMLAAHGMVKAMPITLKGALDCLKKDVAFKDWIGEALLKYFLSIKDKEVEQFGKMTEDKRRLRFLEYF
ncbi:uncharacterized protein LDX57_004737 [Aspergillus melleus]|uniref:uncharacterized protein n=1 Tax=Aspergillus melleus TaxID=138277 RepID=UPI001E8D531E|nr:uncharacterized protein LDX57_004737 [Aspergillus melleus]KAH8427016.1 hypothetical protein LDX57_004737 [Aspergillus melleus]